MKTLEELLNSSDDPSTDDLENLSTDEIRTLAESKAVPTQPTTAEPGDPEESADKEPEGNDDAEVVYRRVIDLGDGAGKEVFEAPTMEALLDKIVEAKANATKKIREQQAQLKEIEGRKAAYEAADKDDEFILSQEMMTRPTDAVKKAFKRATGMDISEFKSVAERVKAMDAAQSAQTETQAQETAANAFIFAHPEYVANQTNGARLSRAVNLLVAEAKQSGKQVDYSTLLVRAYDDLSQSGLLELKSDDAEATEPKVATGAATSRIAKPEEGARGQQSVRRSSSLAGRARAIAAPKAKTPTEDELYSMPLDKLRELANASMGG